MSLRQKEWLVFRFRRTEGIVFVDLNKAGAIVLIGHLLKREFYPLKYFSIKQLLKAKDFNAKDCQTMFFMLKYISNEFG